MPYRRRTGAPDGSAAGERGRPQRPDEVPYPHPERRLVVLGPQRAVPPTRIPRVPRVELAVRYEPVIAHTTVCGDFYEVMPVGRRVLIGIGDVVGHSAHAATVMADLLPVLRALVHRGDDLRAVLRGLNDVILRYWSDHTATVCLMLLDPATGALEVANAGHPPPLVCTDGLPRYLRHGGVLLGVAGEEPGVQRLALPPGGVVVLFTDGLVERRGVPLDDGLERLRMLCAGVDGDLEGLCDRILGAFGIREDDVALVALRRR